MATSASGWLLLAVLSVLVVAGCSGGKVSAPSPGSSSPTGRPTSPPGTGGTALVPPELAPLLKIATDATDVMALLSQATLRQTVCGPAADPDSLTVKCPDGARPGTLVPFFRLSACEPAIEPIPRDRALQVMMALPRPLVGVVRGSLNLRPDPWTGDAEYAIVVRAGGAAQGQGVVFLVTAGKFSAVVDGCGRTPEQFLQNVSRDQLLTLP